MAAAGNLTIGRRPLQTTMDKKEFHATLRRLICLTIDNAATLTERKITGDPLNPSFTLARMYDNPVAFFLQAPDNIADSIWAIIRPDEPERTDRRIAYGGRRSRTDERRLSKRRVLP